jgi:N-acetylmuramoyl-L-alanine amidase
VLQILPRSSWGALAANTSILAGMSGINQFTVHHSSKESFGTAAIQYIQQEHMGLLNDTTPYYTFHHHAVWGDIGYHFIIDPSNDSDPNTVLIYEGRQLEGLGLSGGPYTIPAAVLSKNTLSGIDICMLGNYQSGTWAGWMLGRETFSETRRKKLEMVLTALSFRYQTPATLTATYPPPPVTSPPISWHQQLAAQTPVVETTECPGDTTISTMSTTQTNVIYDLK